MAFTFVNLIESWRQANAQARCHDATGDDAIGFCLDAPAYMPAGSTLQVEPRSDATVIPFCVTTQTWRGA